MMFALRGSAVCISVFVMVYCATSIAVSLSWRHLIFGIRQRPVRQVADLLFVWRIFPLLSAAAVTAAFTIPSFLLLEPRSIHEPLGAVPIALAFCGAAFVLFGAVKATTALRRARRAISSWTKDALPTSAGAKVPVLRICGKVPPITAAGIVRSRVLLSCAAESVLTANELRTALNHELAHLRRRDNLKKLLLQFTSFPGMQGLESAWLEATEMAADDAAVASAPEALDLAAALIKVSRLAPLEDPVELTAALIRTRAGSVRARVERLIAWKDQQCVLSTSSSSRLTFGLTTTLATIAAVAMSYMHLLIGVHMATEWLVR